jgi:hypothetical protein
MSLNLPAQSFYQSRRTLLDLCDRASIKKVIFYCGKCHGSISNCKLINKAHHQVADPAVQTGCRIT